MQIHIQSLSLRQSQQRRWMVIVQCHVVGKCTSKQLKPSRHGDDEDEWALINEAWGDYY
jgi:hypothetical protein